MPRAHAPVGDKPNGSDDGRSTPSKARRRALPIQTGLDGALVRPGDILQVGDRDRAGLRRWGRIKAATINTITLDNALTLPAGTYTISCTLPDATLVERTISSIAGSVVTIGTNFVTIPDPQASWLIAGADLQPTYYRVISRAEPETHRFEILALLHEPSKYGAIEIPSPPLPPQNLLLSPYYGINISVGVAWSAPEPAIYTTGYQIEYTLFNQQPVTANTSSPAYLITGVGYGDLQVRVRSIDTNGDYSGWVVSTISIVANAYFAACYLGDIANSWFASTANPTPDTLQATNYQSAELIQAEPQATFTSSTYTVILNP
jgi:hypothetical protein